MIMCRIEDDIYKQLKKIKKEEGVNINWVVNKAVKEFLDKR